MRKRIYVILTLLCSLSTFAQVGQQFWFASPEMARHSADMQLQLCVFADSLDADITIAMPASSSFPVRTIHVPAFSHQTVLLAPDYTYYMRHIAAYHNSILPNALSISASAPVSCYIQMTGVNGEIYTLKGENALGTEFSLALQNRFRNSNTRTKHQIYENAYASAQVIATEDSTLVTIYPTQLLYPDTTLTPRQVMLHRGQVYSFRAVSKRAEAHPTATRIVASKPISVLTMDDSMSPYQKYMGEDAVADQQVPTSLLGTDYIALSNGLNWEGLLVTDLTTDSTEFISMRGREALYIHRNHPVQVLQLSGLGNEAGGTQLPTLYNSGSRRVVYARPNDSRWTRMHILTPTANTSAIRIDGQLLDTALFTPVPEAEEWSYATVDMSRHAKDKTITITSDGDIFHLSIIDASSAVRSKQGYAVPTSCSFGYFSSYAHPIPEPEVILPPVEVAEVAVVDTLPVLPPAPPVVVEDTVPEKPKSEGHHFAMYMLGAYSHIPFGNSDFRWGLGYGVGLGFLYEYQHNHFLLDLGVGVLWQDVEHRSESDASAAYTDTQGDECTLSMHIRRSDRVRMGYVEVPLLVGGQWNGFYLMGGVKAGVPLWGNTRSEARMSNWAMYDKYFVPFQQMPNHGLRLDEPVTRRHARPSYIADTRLSLELGLRLRRYRLGVYADYGVLWPKMDNGTTPLMDMTDPLQPSTWSLHHPLSSSVSNGKYAHTFFTGLRFTIVLY